VTLTVATEPDLDRIEGSHFTVRPEYIDFNGHMNVAYYSVLMDAACDALRERLGLDEQSLGRAGVEWLLRQSHIVYRRELMQGDRVNFDVQALDQDAHGLHFMLGLRHAGEGWLAASCEIVAGCVSKDTREEMGWPQAARMAVARWRDAHRGRPRPAEAGRAVAVRGAMDPAALPVPSAEARAALAACVRDADTSDLRVGTEHIDARDRIRPGFYTVFAGRAMRRVAGPAFGMGSGNMQRTGQTGYVAESRNTQLRALRLGDPMAFDFKVAGLSDKALHIVITLKHAGEGWIAAVHEQITLCMDAATRRPTAFHPSVRARLESALFEHRHAPDPVPAGHPLGLGI